MRPLNQLLSPNLLERARLLQTMTRSVQDLLSEPLASHCWVGGVHGKYLHLVADGSAWATRLRYQQHDILKRINSEFGLTLKALRIKMISPSRQASPIKQTPRAVSAAAATALNQAARSTDDPELKAAFLRLAKRSRP